MMKPDIKSITNITIAACLVVLAADQIYERFFDRTPARVYVLGGDMSVTVDGGYLRSIEEVQRLNYAELAPLSWPLEVEVKGGKLDYPTDFRGNLKVSIDN